MAEGVIVTSVAEKVVDSMFVVAKKEIGYMWNCKQLVEKFKSEVQNLKDMKGRIQQKIELAKNKGDTLVVGVQDWINAATAEILEAEEFITKKTCFGTGLCGNWSTLHHYGKKAAQTDPLMELKAGGTIYESCVSLDTPAILDCYQNKNLVDIVTHNSVLDNIIKALEDDSKQVIGVYGVGGVGKTTLAKEVNSRVKTMFADVAFTTISKQFDVEKIQKDTENARKRIINGEKILIILDDVWEELNLDEVCIPCGINHTNCKILLTSRSKDVCKKMNAQSKISVNSLPLEEAWILFKHVVGDKLETDTHLSSVAYDIAKECRGLPLIIDVIGKTLKNKDVSSWKLSYDYLKSEAQWCFLQCSLFPEDSYILLEDLVLYRVGLEKSKEIESIEDARSTVQNAVNILMSYGLLLDINSKFYIRMHDVCRDMALSIVNEGSTNHFLVMAGEGLTEWLPRNNIQQSYTVLSLMENRISKLPEDHISFPNLEAAYLQCNQLTWISEEFIEEIKNARVLDLNDNEISSLPQSLARLSQLRMLNLKGNRSICEISIIGELKGLEILILNDTGIEEVPECIGQLVNLRRLEVRDCFNLSRMPPDAISKLQRLEELRIQFPVHCKQVHECLAAVNCLSKLTCLELKVPSVHDIPEGFNFDKLKGFAIKIERANRSFGFEYVWTSERHLALNRKYLVLPFIKWMKKLIEVSRPIISLSEIENLNNIIPDLDQEGFNNIEHINLKSCKNVTCLVDTCDWGGNANKKFLREVKRLILYGLDKLEVLWKCPDEFISLTNLVTLYIYDCHKLVRLFPLSVAKGLVSLKEVQIQLCKNIEEVIWGETETDEVVFPCLTTIHLGYCYELKSFYSGSCSINYPSLVEVTSFQCHKMEMWGHGSHETPKLKFVNNVPLDGGYSINDAIVEVSMAQKASLSVFSILNRNLRTRREDNYSFRVNKKVHVVYIEQLRLKNALYCSELGDNPKHSSSRQNSVTAGRMINALGIDFSTFFRKNLFEGSLTLFWEDLWCGNGSLKNRLSSEVRKLEDEISNISFKNNGSDSLVWSLSSNDKWSTKTLTSLLVQHSASQGNIYLETIINRLVPSNVGLFIWQASISRTPCRVELDKRGLDLDSVRYPVCDDNLETTEHSLANCKRAREVWEQIYKWWQIVLPAISILPSYLKALGSHSILISVNLFGKRWIGYPGTPYENIEMKRFFKETSCAARQS
ncbi:probable disease resistance protein At4g27220 [Rutidosis leptorrhynchoides]|uniref:probable disease resistance protein At4g27220 n=1 Tax=Rutidosis leptorrhynchoides TaxID=125765 RepID=UPI003A99F55B